jgi:hypothetical protein
VSFITKKNKMNLFFSLFLLSLQLSLVPLSISCIQYFLVHSFLLVAAAVASLCTSISSPFTPLFTTSLSNESFQIFGMFFMEWCVLSALEDALLLLSSVSCRERTFL